MRSRVVLGFAAVAVLAPGAVLAALWAAPRQPASPAATAAVRLADGRPVTRSSPDGRPVNRYPAGGQPVTIARVATRDGQLSFEPPPGWRLGDCPSGADSCIEVAPTAVGSGDSVDVLVAALPPGESGPAEPAPSEADRVTVAGLPAVRLDLASDGSVVVFGSMPGGDDRFMVSCRYLRDEPAIRYGCERIVKSLRIG